MKTDAKAAIVAAKSFPEGDPRRGPFSADEKEEAIARMEEPGRWCKAADMYVARLQFSRGLSYADIGRMLSISDTAIGKRARNQRWNRMMSDRDRQSLSRLIWLAGLVRGAGASAGRLRRLRGQSDWRLIGDATAPADEFWRPIDRVAQAPIIPTQSGLADHAYYSEEDEKREQHAAMRAHLQSVLDEIEASVANDDEEPDDHEEEVAADDEVAEADLVVDEGASGEG